jgi:hypothetical protein
MAALLGEDTSAPTCRLDFSAAMRMGAALAPRVAQRTRLPLDCDLKIALADFASQKRRKHHRSVDDLESNARRELDRLEFALPNSSVEARSKLLLAHRWNHKDAIQAEVKRKLSAEAGKVFSAFPEGQYNHIITRAFAASKTAPRPLRACIALLEEQATQIGRKRPATSVLGVGAQTSGGGGEGLPPLPPRSKPKAPRERIRAPVRSQ